MQGSYNRRVPTSAPDHELGEAGAFTLWLRIDVAALTTAISRCTMKL